MEKQKAYIAAIIIQWCFAGTLVLSKAAISSGMKPSVFVAYRQAFASLALLPFAFFFPSKDDSPPLTWIGCCKFFFVSLYGIALSFNLSFAGLEYASATIAGAGFAMILPLVFIISICLRVETLVISERHGIAKVVGTIICVCGSMAFTFYKGPPLYSHSRNDHHENTPKREEWIKGSLLCIAASVLYSLWLTHQAQLLKQYPGKLRFTIVQSGFSCVAASVYAAATQRHLFSWKLGWNIQLLSVAYSGLIVTGMSLKISLKIAPKLLGSALFTGRGIL